MGRVLKGCAVRITNGELDLWVPPHLHLRCYSWTGELSANVAALVSVLTSRGGTFLDIGAFAGQHSQRAVLASKGSCRVVAFEADPRARQLLVGNLEARSMLPAVEVRSEAVGVANGVSAFTLADVPSLSGLETAARGKVVQVPTLDILDVVNEYQPTLMKLDVEGLESALLERLQGLKRDALPVMIIEQNAGVEESARKLGLEVFTTRQLFPEHASLSNLTDDILAFRPHSLDIVALKRDARSALLGILKVPKVSYTWSQ